MSNKVVYLAGPIECAVNSGIGWRREYQQIFKDKLGYKCIIPNDEEEDIVQGRNLAELKLTNLNEYKKIYNEFHNRDLDFVRDTDFTVVKWDGELMYGTIGELTYAHRIGKSAYLITNQPIENINGWFLVCFDKVFSHIDELIDYLIGEEV